MIPNSAVQTKIAQIRLKISDGTVTETELKEAVALMREGRVASAISSETAKRKTAIKEIPKAQDLLDELNGI